MSGTKENRPDQLKVDPPERFAALQWRLIWALLLIAVGLPSALIAVGGIVVITLIAF